MRTKGNQGQKSDIENILRRWGPRISVLLGFAAIFLITGPALAHERWILSPDQIAEWNAHPWPKLYSKPSPSM